MKSLSIPTPKGIRHIGPGHPVFIVGEMSGNHNLNFERALRLIDGAVDAGLDAVKIQTYTADTLTIDCDNPHFQIKANEAWAGQTLYSLYKRAHTPWEWQPKLRAYAESKGILLFSTPFDETAVDFLEDNKMPVYKVASFECTHLPLLRRIGQTGKPVILSRGLTSESELGLAVSTLRHSGCPAVAVLHCISSYPAEPSQMNLRLIPYLANQLDVVVGLSDHSLCSEPAIAAVALGASIIEKHFTTKRSAGGPDASFSLEFDELCRLVSSIRTTESALGSPTFELDGTQKENIVFRRSIFIIKALNKGDILSPENIRIIRPGFGLSPKHFDEVIGKRVKQPVSRGTPLDWDLIE